MYSLNTSKQSELKRLYTKHEQAADAETYSTVINCPKRKMQTQNTRFIKQGTSPSEKHTNSMLSLQVSKSTRQDTNIKVHVFEVHIF